MSFVIDPRSVSFTKIKADLQSYVASKPDSSVWKDFYASSAGTVIIELIAGLAAYEQYNTIMQRRETFLSFAQAVSSAKAIAGNLGYSADRGANIKFNLRVVPTSSRVLKNLEIIGTHGPLSLICMADIVLNTGVAATIPCTIGSIATASITYSSTVPQIVKFTLPTLSEDIQVLLDGAIVPVSTRILDLLGGKYIVTSNPEGAVDIVYLNNVSTDPFFHIAGSTLTLEGISYDSAVLSLTTVTFFYGTIDLVSVDGTGTLYSIETAPIRVPETADDIRKSAPLYHETQVLLRARQDYKKVLLAIDSTIEASNSIDISPSVTNLTYLKKDRTILTPAGETALLLSMEPYRPFGVEAATVVSPVAKQVSLGITISMVTPSIITTAELKTLWKDYEYVFQVTLSLLTMEHIAEASLPHIETVRVVNTNGVAPCSWNEYYVFTLNITVI